MPFVNIASNIIHLDANFDLPKSVDFIAALTQMTRNEDGRQVEVHVTSTGGSTSGAIAIAQAMRASKVDVSTYGFGCVESAAILVLAAGTPGLRSVYEGTLMSMHEHYMPYSNANSGNGTVTDWANYTEKLEQSVDRVYWLLGEVTKRNKTFWKDMIKDRRDTIICHTDAKKFGLVDAIIRI